MAEHLLAKTRSPALNSRSFGNQPKTRASACPREDPRQTVLAWSCRAGTVVVHMFRLTCVCFPRLSPFPARLSGGFCLDSFQVFIVPCLIAVYPFRSAQNLCPLGAVRPSDYIETCKGILERRAGPYGYFGTDCSAELRLDLFWNRILFW